MEQQSRQLALAGFGLVAISALVHLAIGFSQIVSGLRGDGALAIGLLMLFAGILALGLVGVFYTGAVRPTYTYVASAGLMLLYVVAYADVHAIGTLESITGTDLHSHDHSHGDGHDHGHDDDHDHDHDDGHDHNDGHDDSHGHDDGHGHGHAHDDDSTVTVVIDHLREDMVALGTKLSEIGAATLLLVAVALEPNEEKSN